MSRLSDVEKLRRALARARRVTERAQRVAWESRSAVVHLQTQHGATSICHPELREFIAAEVARIEADSRAVTVALSKLGTRLYGIAQFTGAKEPKR